MFLTHAALSAEPKLESDPIAKLAARAPKGWTVELGRSGQCCILIKTQPMVTVPGSTSNASEEEFGPVVIRFEILPRYSLAMLNRIEKYNEPISTQFHKTSYFSPEYLSLREQFIPLPMFEDGEYAYRILPPNRIPKKEADFDALDKALQNLCSDWKPMKKDGMQVKDIGNFFQDR